MLYLCHLQEYIADLKNCVKVSANIDVESKSVLTTTETYQYDQEHEANKQIGFIKDKDGFISCKKKFVPAKEKKGELISDEYWLLTVTIRHDL